jgi:hypothetical protein
MLYIQTQKERSIASESTVVTAIIVGKLHRYSVDDNVSTSERDLLSGLLSAVHCKIFLLLINF